MTPSIYQRSQSPHSRVSSHPDKAQAILAVEQHIGGHFLAEAQSNNGRSIRWLFSEPFYHDIIPVTVDVTAYPTRAEVEAATTAAVSEADTIYRWLNDKGYQKTSEPLDSPAHKEVLDAYLERLKKDKD